MREEEPIAVAGSLVAGESGGIEMRFESILQMKKHPPVVGRLRLQDSDAHRREKFQPRSSRGGREDGGTSCPAILKVQGQRDGG